MELRVESFELLAIFTAIGKKLKGYSRFLLPIF